LRRYIAVKRTNLIIVVLVIVALVVGAILFLQQGKEEEKEQVVEKEFKVGMVTDVGGLGDQSFNDAAWRGLERAEEELGVKIQVVESSKMNDYVPNLKSLADQDYNMVWAIGFLMTDSLKEIADMYPDTTFGIIDAMVDKENVASVTFMEEQGSYLVGVVAGMETEVDKIGYIGGMEMPLIKKFEAGFKAGAKEVNPDVEILTGYTGAFDDPQSGKELAFTQFSQGADIVYHASGACGIGVIKAAEERDKYAIGVDSPQYHLAPENVLTSMIKRVDVAVYNEVKALYNDEFKAGHKVYGLAQEGVGVYREQAEKMVAEDTMKKVEEYKEKIISGEIEVPTEPKN